MTSARWAPPGQSRDGRRRREVGERMNGFGDKVGFIWSVADLLRGDYKPHEYGRVVLPFVLLRRLDSVLAPTKQEVLAEYEKHKGSIQNLDPILNRAAR